MHLLVVLFLVAVLVGLALWFVAGPRTTTSRREASDLPPAEVQSGGRVVLDLEAADPDHPSVRRLVDGAAQRALDATPTLRRVEVVDRQGRRLGVREVSTPLTRTSELPASLHTPHLRPSRAPDPLRSQGRGETDASSAGRFREAGLSAVEQKVAPRPFAARFELPDEVRDRISDPDHPAAVVAALLTAAGRPVERRGDLVLSGDLAIAVALVDGGSAAALTRAFLRVSDTGAPRAIVIRLGYVDPFEVQRRQAAAPDVRHVDSDAIQRMADAVALGADPVAFAVSEHQVLAD